MLYIKGGFVCVLFFYTLVLEIFSKYYLGTGGNATWGEAPADIVTLWGGRRCVDVREQNRM